jgi:predicted HicB family RNase H-like nuclease
MTGPTPEEAVKELLVEKPEWFETCLKLGIEIPMPVQNKKYRGKIALRVSPSMHAAVTRIAELEGISLNQ